MAWESQQSASDTWKGASGASDTWSSISETNMIYLADGSRLANGSTTAGSGAIGWKTQTGAS